MRLLAKTNKFFLAFVVTLFPIMVGIDYFLIRSTVNEELNELLVNEGERIKYQLQQGLERLETTVPYDTLTIRANIEDPGSFRDTMLTDAYDRVVPYRTYSFTATVDDRNVKVTLRHILIEINDLVVWLVFTTALVLILLLAGIFLINHKISNWAWRPFYNNMSKLKSYSIHKKGEIALETSDIDEFESLNRVISSMIDQIRTDFENLKEFNENISHEMQTPLSIIRNKMVLLLDSPHLNDKELNWIEAAYQEANKLSKIGKSLTLISKIENQEFQRTENVNVQVIVDDILNNMEEIIAFKNLNIEVSSEVAMMKCDPILANILFTNLIKNAVQHNEEGGYLRIDLKKDCFTIENSGSPLTTDSNKLVNRFHKGTTDAESLGLGLAISQKICDIYDFKLQHDHHDRTHKFTLLFGQG